MTLSPSPWLTAHLNTFQGVPHFLGTQLTLSTSGNLLFGEIESEGLLVILQIIRHIE